MRSVEYEDSFVKIAGLIGGEEYHKVARSLLNSEDATDEEIASATGLRINIIRKVLYDMFGKALIPGRYICSYLFYLVAERLFYFTIINHVKGSFADRAFEEYFDCRVKLDTGTILFSTVIELR